MSRGLLEALQSDQQSTGVFRETVRAAADDSEVWLQGKNGFEGLRVFHREEKDQSAAHSEHETTQLVETAHDVAVELRLVRPRLPSAAGAEPLVFSTLRSLEAAFRGCSLQQ